MRNSGIIRLYRDVSDTGVIPSTHSAQMEVAHPFSDDAVLLQARLARRFEPYTNLDVSAKMKEFGDCSGFETIPFNVVGVGQAEEDIELSNLTPDRIEALAALGGAAYELDLNEKRNSRETLNCFPKNMDVYLPWQHAFRIHGHFRWMQKARITIPGVIDLLHAVMNTGRRRDPHSVPEQTRLKAFSNGIIGGIVRTQ